MAEPRDIDAFHHAIDQQVAQLEQLHRGRLQCARGCSACCVDDIRVFAVEADLIRRRHPEVLASAPHAPGACAFLDAEGACRVYDARPYVCRTQGLPLRWLDEHDGEMAEFRDICELNEAPEGWDGPLITDLEPAACWGIGPAEGELQQLQLAHGDDLARVPLRSLFQSDDEE